MPSHQCVLFSFVPIYLLADSIPCFFNTWIPLPSVWPHSSTLAKSLGSPGFMSQLCKGKWAEMTQKPFLGQTPWVVQFLSFRSSETELQSNSSLFSEAAVHQHILQRGYGV